MSAHAFQIKHLIYNSARASLTRNCASDPHVTRFVKPQILQQFLPRLKHTHTRKLTNHIHTPKNKTSYQNPRPENTKTLPHPPPHIYILVYEYICQYTQRAQQCSLHFSCSAHRAPAILCRWLGVYVFCVTLAYNNVHYGRAPYIAQ